MFALPAKYVGFSLKICKWSNSPERNNISIMPLFWSGINSPAAPVFILLRQILLFLVQSCKGGSVSCPDGSSHPGQVPSGPGGGNAWVTLFHFPLCPFYHPPISLNCGTLSFESLSVWVPIPVLAAVFPACPSLMTDRPPLVLAASQGTWLAIKHWEDHPPLNRSVDQFQLTSSVLFITPLIPPLARLHPPMHPSIPYLLFFSIQFNMCFCFPLWCFSYVIFFLTAKLPVTHFYKWRLFIDTKTQELPISHAYHHSITLQNAYPGVCVCSSQYFKSESHYVKKTRFQFNQERD